MPRLVRRKPMLERIKANLDVVDWFFYLSEIFETSDLDIKSLGTTIGLGCNFVYLLARANSGRKSKNVDDVFGDSGSAGWFGWFVRHFSSCLLQLHCDILRMLKHNFVGSLLSADPKYRLPHECGIHLPSPASLPPLRDTSIQCAINTQCVSSACRLLSIHQLSTPSRPKDYICLLSSISCTSRFNSRRLGTCDLGPYPILPYALPVLLTGTHCRILALFTNRNIGSTTKHDRLHHPASPSTHYSSDVFPDREFPSTGKGYSRAQQRSHERV